VVGHLDTKKIAIIPPYFIRDQEKRDYMWNKIKMTICTVLIHLTSPSIFQIDHWY